MRGIVTQMHEGFHGGEGKRGGEIDGALSGAVPAATGELGSFTAERLLGVPAFDDPESVPQE